MNQRIEGVSIKAIASCVPKTRITGDKFKDLLSEKEIRKFEKTTGILERRYANDNVTASDLGYIAAKKILDSYQEDLNIQALIFLSQTSDYKIPFTSNILQERLHLPKDILCLDVNAGCAGFIQGLSTSFAIANTISNGQVLFIVAETLSKILSEKDRSTSMIFGDGASALLVEKDSTNYSETVFNFFSDGSGYDAIMIPDGGNRNPFNLKSLELKLDSNGSTRSAINLFMDGPRVFDFTLREIPPSISKLMETYDIGLNDIDYFLLHQSNKFIIKQICSKLGIENSKILLNIHRFGNTSGVSIPLLFTTELVRNSKPLKLLLTGYGAGLNWANCVLELKPECKIYDLIEI